MNQRAGLDTSVLGAGWRVLQPAPSLCRRQSAQARLDCAARMADRAQRAAAGSAAAAPCRRGLLPRLPGVGRRCRAAGATRASRSMRSRRSDWPAPPAVLGADARLPPAAAVPRAGDPVGAGPGVSGLGAVHRRRRLSRSALTSAGSRRSSPANPACVSCGGAANGGIAAATNDALAVATGDYCLFLDQDDLLARSALFEFAARGSRPAARRHPVRGRGSHRRDRSPVAPVLQAGLGSRVAAHDELCAAPGCRRGRRCCAASAACVPVSTASRTGTCCCVSPRQVAPDAVVHIPRVLYHWREHAGSTAAGIYEKAGIVAAQERALRDSIARRGETRRHRASVRWMADPLRAAGGAAARQHRHSHARPRRSCCAAAWPGSASGRTMRDWEAVIVDNDSTDPEALQFIASLAGDRRFNGRARGRRLQLLGAVQCGRGSVARGEIVVLLNNDVDPIHADWLDETGRARAAARHRAGGRDALLPRRHDPARRRRARPQRHRRPALHRLPARISRNGRPAPRRAHRQRDDHRLRGRAARRLSGRRRHGRVACDRLQRSRSLPARRRARLSQRADAARGALSTTNRRAAATSTARRRMRRRRPTKRAFARSGATGWTGIPPTIRTLRSMARRSAWPIRRGTRDGSPCASSDGWRGAGKRLGPMNPAVHGEPAVAKFHRRNTAPASPRA